MTVRLTQKRIDLIRSALCYLEAEYDSDDQLVLENFGLSQEEFDKELEACFEWLRQTERKRRNRKPILT
jgi:hypothetical protein